MASKIKLPSWFDILPSINMEAVAEAILQPKREGEAPLKYGYGDYENVKSMVWAAAERWVPRDLTTLSCIEGVEEKVSGFIGDSEVKAFLDVHTTLNGQMEVFSHYAGMRMIVDWKTRDGELDQPWRNRNLDSWQWRIYSYLAGAGIFNYRGISSRGYQGDYGTKDILIEVPATNDEEVVQYIKAQNAQRKALIDGGFEVWPRKQPDACNAFGRLCPFKRECEEYSMPRFIPKADKVMSYTSFNRFSLCPERSRRLLEEGVGDEIDSSDESTIGSGFHLGIAEVYKQVKELVEKGKFYA